MELHELLGIQPGVTAIIGSGGKTTLLGVLRRELRQKGAVILCTTTHIRMPADMPVCLDASEGDVAMALALWNQACVGTPAGENKLTAPALPMARLAALADCVLVEADGSRGLPLKAHRAAEPVIPPESRQVITVLGLSGLGRPIREAAHCPELYADKLGVSVDTVVTPALAARLLAAEGWTQHLFLNQAETGADWAAAREIAAYFPDVPVAAGALQKGEWQCLR